MKPPRSLLAATTLLSSAVLLAAGGGSQGGKEPPRPAPVISSVSVQVDPSRQDATGAIERLEVTSLTRQRASCWARTVLHQVARGSRQTFTGEVAIANVPIPVRTPISVMVQEKPGGRNQAVFFLDLDLAKMPAELMKSMGTKACDLTLKGTLTGEKGSSARVCAVGVLRYGTSDIVAPASNVELFVKFGGARLTGVSVMETSGEATVLLFNPFGFDVPVKELSWSLYARDRKLCAGSKRGFFLRSARETRVDLAAEARNADLVAAAGSALTSGGTLDGRLVGSVTLKVGRDEVRIPVDLAGAIRVVR